MDSENYKIQDKVYNLLTGLGYVRYAKNVKVVSKIKDSSGTWDAFEDWYTHKDLGLQENTFIDEKFTNIFKYSIIDKGIEELKRFSRKLHYYKSKII